MNIYVYDHTEEGFYTAVFDAYRDENAFISCDDVQFGLMDRENEVVTDERKALRVLKKLREYDNNAEWEISIVLRSDLKDRAKRAFDYLKLIVENRRPVRERFADDRVFSFLDALRKVMREVDRLRGMLRFHEIKNGVLYAPYAPDNDITTILAPHFIRRLHTPFIIHDLKRHFAYLYNGESVLQIPLEKAEIVLSAEEDGFTALWKKYYDTVNIPQRKNIKQMKQYMPVRYWKYLPEKQPSGPLW